TRFQAAWKVDTRGSEVLGIATSPARMFAAPATSSGALRPRPGRGAEGTIGAAAGPVTGMGSAARTGGLATTTGVCAAREPPLAPKAFLGAREGATRLCTTACVFAP